MHLFHGRCHRFVRCSPYSRLGYRHRLGLPVLSVLTAHISCSQLVGLFHQCQLLVHSGIGILSAFKLGFQHGYTLLQLVHLLIVPLRFFIETSQSGVQVAVGIGRRLHRALHLRGFSLLFLCDSGIHQAVFVFRYIVVCLSLEHIAKILHRTFTALLPCLQFAKFVCLCLVADDFRTIGKRHLCVEALRLQFLLLVFLGRCEYPPHRADEQQSHQRIDNQFVTFLPLCLSQGLFLLLRFFRLCGSYRILVLLFVLFHCCCCLIGLYFFFVEQAPIVGYAQSLSACRHSFRCHTPPFRRCTGQMQQIQQTS